MNAIKAVVSGSIFVDAVLILIVLMFREDAWLWIVVYWLLNTVLCGIKAKEEKDAMKREDTEE
jgi:hypothetical protein